VEKLSSIQQLKNFKLSWDLVLITGWWNSFFNTWWYLLLDE